MFSIRSLLLFFAVFLMASVSVRGQLSADNALVAQTEYSSATPNDQVFCFPEGSSMSVRFDYAGNNPSFAWFQHDVTDNSWDNLLANTGNQLVAGSPGGYRVVVEDEGGLLLRMKDFGFTIPRKSPVWRLRSLMMIAME